VGSSLHARAAGPNLGVSAPIRAKDLHVVRLCSVFEPPEAALDVRFDPIGGMQNHCAQLVRALDRRGIRQTVVTTRPPGAPREHVMGEQARIRRHGLPLPVARQLYAPPAAGDLLRASGDADLLHVHLGEDLAVIPVALAVARARRLPLVLTIHCSLRHTYVRTRDPRSQVLGRLGGALELRGARAAAGVIVLTPRLRELLVHDGVDRARISVVPSGVASAEFRTAGPDCLDGIGRPRVVFVGRLARQKGVTTLVEAAARLRTPGVRVVLVGDGPERPAVEALVARHDLGDRVTVTGFLSHGAVPPILTGADLVVLPSIYEELGSVLVEAMQAGAAIVASDTGGIPDAVGDAAQLVEPGDPAALAEAIDALLADPARAARLRRLAAERSRSYDWDGLAGRIHALYRRCLSR
jgi:glycosyltransferase involved in cell wall biosynthesis